MSDETHEEPVFQFARSEPIPAAVADAIDRWFTYHPPTPEQIPVYEALRGQAREFAAAIFAACPSCGERDRALAALRETVMWANAGIACGGGS